MAKGTPRFPEDVTCDLTLRFIWHLRHTEDRIFCNGFSFTLLRDQMHDNLQLSEFQLAFGLRSKEVSRMLVKK